MKKFIVLSFLTFIYAFALCAQSMSVASFTFQEHDITPNLPGTMVLDQNGNKCALIRIQTTQKGFSFDVGSLGVQKVDENHVGEVWVYVPAGVRKIDIRHQQLGSLLDYTFPVSIKAASTYRMELTTATITTIVQQDDGKTYYSLTVSPKNAMVLIDGELRALDSNGELMLRLPRGQHTYSVQAPGYAAKAGQFSLGATKLIETITLESVLATINITGTTAGTEIYVNEELMGTGSWSGTLAAGSYVIEGRLEGHHQQRINVTLAEQEQKTVQIPALVARTGQLDVSYRPANSEVWLDGKKLGTSPDIFRDVIIGQHQVEIRKDGYNGEKKTVTIEEGQTYALSGSLAKIEVPSAPAALEGGMQNGAVKTFTVNGVSFNMVFVAGGTFTMGATPEQEPDASDDEYPTHEVTLSDYFIGQTEVTQELWQAVMGSNPSRFKGANRPVERVSWNDCQTFVSKLSDMVGIKFTLPTEAQWEYAARGGSKSRGYKYSGSNTIDDVAWYKDNAGKKTHTVGTKAANELVIYDMSGNVREWCSDWYMYSSYSYGREVTNPTGPSTGYYRVYRGGCRDAAYCRVSKRDMNTPDYSYKLLGLRLVSPSLVQ